MRNIASRLSLVLLAIAVATPAFGEVGDSMGGQVVGSLPTVSLTPDPAEDELYTTATVVGERARLVVRMCGDRIKALTLRITFHNDKNRRAPQQYRYAEKPEMAAEKLTNDVVRRLKSEGWTVDMSMTEGLRRKGGKFAYVVQRGVHKRAMQSARATEGGAEVWHFNLTAMSVTVGCNGIYGG
jgi:hypothetical protein